MGNSLGPGSPEGERLWARPTPFDDATAGARRSAHSFWGHVRDSLNRTYRTFVPVKLVQPDRDLLHRIQEEILGSGTRVDGVMTYGNRAVVSVPLSQSAAIEGISPIRLVALERALTRRIWDEGWNLAYDLRVEVVPDSALVGNQPRVVLHIDEDPFAVKVRPPTGDPVGYLVTRFGGRHALRLGQTLRVGRDDRCDLVLDRRTVSRVHAIVRAPLKPAGRITVEDRWSDNGTYVKGHGDIRGRGEVTVTPGGRIAFADSAVNVEAGP